MTTLLLLIVIALLLIDRDERRQREQRAETILCEIGLAERRIARLADQALLRMIDEVRQGRSTSGA